MKLSIFFLLFRDLPINNRDSVGKQVKAKENLELLHRVNFHFIFHFISLQRQASPFYTALLFIPAGSHYSYQKFQGKHQTIPKYPILYFFPCPHICQKKKNILTSPSLKSSPTTVTPFIWSPVLAVKLYWLKSLGFKNNLFSCAHICPRCPFIEFTEYKWKKVITRQSV